MKQDGSTLTVVDFHHFENALLLTVIRISNDEAHTLLFLTSISH